MNYDKVIINILISNKGKFHKSLIKKAMELPNVSLYIKSRFENSNSLIETLHRMECYSQIIPKCPICGNDCGYRRYKYPNIVFLKTCGSIECRRKLQVINYEFTSLNKYGCKNAGQSDQAKEKRKQTCLDKYGAESFTNREKYKQTCLEKYGVLNGGGSKESLEKIKNTNIQKRGVPYVFMSDEFKEKAKKTLFKHYGVSTPLASEICKQKMIRTNQERYGKDYPMSCDWFKENIKKTCQEKYGVNQVNQFTTSYLWDTYKSNMVDKYGYDHVFKVPKIKNKIYNTMMSRYGAKTYSQTNEYKTRINQINQKIINTKKKNHTFNTSKPEEELYEYIKKKFPSVERQYNKDPRYPWACDFYIKELDLFLELQGTWLHGKHPFDGKSSVDMKTLEEWKLKHKDGKHPMYLKAISTWTIEDVEKRNKALKNKLNYKEVWSLNEGKTFVDSL